MTTQTEALKLALEALKTAQNNLAPSKGSAHAYGDGELWDKYADSITALEALAQSEQQEQLRFEVDGEMLTASQLIGVELFNFQQATKCDTAAEFLAQSEQEPVAVLFEDGSIVKYEDLEFAPEKSGQRVQMLYTTPPQHFLMAEYWKAEYDRRGQEGIRISRLWR